MAGKLPLLNNALKILEQEKKKRENHSILFLPDGFMDKKERKGSKKGKIGMIPGLIMQHTKKLDFFKGSQNKASRRFYPKGINPNIFVFILAGFNNQFIHPYGHGKPGKQLFLPHGNMNMNGSNEENKNKAIPYPLGPNCKKIFGLTGKEGTGNNEKLRYFGDYEYNNYKYNYGYNYNNYGYTIIIIIIIIIIITIITVIITTN